MGYDSALVVPTNRPGRVRDFLKAWKGAPFDLVVVVYDGEDATSPEAEGLSSLGEPGLKNALASGFNVEVLDWSSIDRFMPEKARPIFSRCDSAIRSFGFYRAWKAGAKVIFSLDDDCYPIGCPTKFVRTHVYNLEGLPRWVSSVPGLRVRGMPYQNSGAVDTGLSVGLWSNHPDLDAPTSLVKGDFRLTLADLEKVGTRVMPSLQYFPFCGMNFAFRRDMTPLAYFPPMGIMSDYARFDDIWAGLVVQRVCRALGVAITVGAPFVEHTRASDPFANLVKEAPGIRDNERMWQIVDRFEIKASNTTGAVLEVGDQMVNWGETFDRKELLAPYVAQWGKNLQTWGRLFL